MMHARATLTVVSDIHYAGPAEVAGGHPRARLTQSVWQNLLMQSWDRWVWMRDPFAHNLLLADFLAAVSHEGWVVANGDFSVDAACVGVSDPAALASASECLGRLRSRLGDRLLTTIGDHELGKTSAIGGKGGLRLASWHPTLHDLALEPFWEREIGNLKLIGVTSSLVGLELLRPDALTTEWSEWVHLREEHLGKIAGAFDRLKPCQRVLLFCHDPSALPFLLELPQLTTRLAQLERTIVGHLHSRVVFATSRTLSGMPPVRFLGTTIRRWTSSLHRAAGWKAFRPLLCPSLAGIELVGRGGWLELSLDPEAGKVTGVTVRPMPRQRHARL